MNWVEPAAYERTRNEGIWEEEVSKKAQEETRRELTRSGKRERVIGQQPTLVCFYAWPGWSLTFVATVASHPGCPLDPPPIIRSSSLFASPSMSDPRFARLKTDPRFRKIRKSDHKVTVDDRFKSIFQDDKKPRNKKSKGPVSS